MATTKERVFSFKASKAAKAEIEAAIEAELERLKRRNPDLQVSTSDALRSLVVLGSTAARTPGEVPGADNSDEDPQNTG